MKASCSIALRATFGIERESRSNQSYCWDSNNREKFPYVILQWTKEGYGIFENAKGSQQVKPGQAFLTLVPEKARYFYPQEATSPWIFSWLNFEGPLAMHFSESLRDEFGPVLSIPFQTPCAWALTQLIQKASRRSFQNRLEEAELCYRFFFLCLEQQKKKGDSPGISLREIAEYYLQHNNEVVAVKEMAERAGLSREHFSRAFHKETGFSPAAFLRNLRLERASAILTRTDLPISDVAESCGFHSPRQFSKTFKRFRGLTPVEFRGQRA